MTFGFRLWDIHIGEPHPFNDPAPPIDNGTARPSPGRYHDAAFARAEWEKVFARSWLLACPVSDVREPGDFAKFDIGTESFIIVRGDDGGSMPITMSARIAAAGSSFPTPAARRNSPAPSTAGSSAWKARMSPLPIRRRSGRKCCATTRA